MNQQQKQEIKIELPTCHLRYKNEKFQSLGTRINLRL
jgi:hypothetical protein